MKMGSTQICSIWLQQWPRGEDVNIAVQVVVGVMNAYCGEKIKVDEGNNMTNMIKNLRTALYAHRDTLLERKGIKVGALLGTMQKVAQVDADNQF